MKSVLQYSYELDTTLSTGLQPTFRFKYLLVVVIENKIDAVNNEILKVFILTSLRI